METNRTDVPVKVATASNGARVALTVLADGRYLVEWTTVDGEVTSSTLTDETEARARANAAFKVVSVDPPFTAAVPADTDTPPAPYPNRATEPCAACGNIVEALTGYRDKVTGYKTMHVDCYGSPAPERSEVEVAGFSPTDQQLECLKLAATGDHLVIQAGAGAGKTSTLKLIAKWAKAQPVPLRIQYLAFNSRIVRDGMGKFGSNVVVSTIHALGYRVVGADMNAPLGTRWEAGRSERKKGRLRAGRINGQNLASLLDVHAINVTNGTDRRTLAAGYLASCALRTVSTFCESEAPEITADMVPDVKGFDRASMTRGQYAEYRQTLTDEVLPGAQRAWRDITNPDGRIPLRHAHYLKVWQLNDPRIDADMVALDEAQDVSPVMASIIENQANHGAQIIAVGDSCQAINEWMGAVDALARLEKIGGKVAWLTQSFRFGPQVAAVADGLLARLGAELRVTGVGPAGTVGPIADPDCILTRTNAGAFRTLMAQIAEGKRAHLAGGAEEIETFAKAALELQTLADPANPAFGFRTTDHPELSCFVSWGEVREFVAIDPNGSELEQMVKLVDDFGAQVIIDATTTAAKEHDADVSVSTAHKSKGLEWDSVQLAGDFFSFRQRPGEPVTDLDPAELMLMYVAVTRARHALDITAVRAAQGGPSAR